MSKPIIKIHNVQTGEEIEREMTDSEFAQYKAQQELDEIQEAKESAKEVARQALLDKLGITAEEAKLLLG
jgi:hypothetical protein